MQDSFELTVNATRHVVRGEPAHRSLLGWLRDSGLTGSKEGCAEGDCGACTVALVERDAEGRTTYRAINSCIALLPMFAGREIVTVEGLACAARGGETPAIEELHPVQRAMVERHGSQCGFCTPGFAMSMMEAYHRDLGSEPERAIADQLHGNLCRCTGYRPIREAMLDARAMPTTPRSELLTLRLSRDAAEPAPLDYEARGEAFHRPRTLHDLCALLSKHDDAVLVAGATEIGVEINKKERRPTRLVSTEGVAELRRITRESDAWVVGGGASLTDVEDTVARELPTLAKMLSVFASRQIRSRATIAGNLVNASPIGDLPPVLLSLDAEVVLARIDGGAIVRRSVPLDAFFTGYRATVRARDEVLVSVRIPHAPAGVARLSDSYKVSKRRELDISIVAAAFAIDLDSEHRVMHARLAYGGVAATPVRARRAEAALVGRGWDERALSDAREAIASELSPISDVRSGREFRAGLAVSLFEKFFFRERSEAQDEALSFRRADRTFHSDASRTLHHESAIGHVTGSALYVDDEARRRGPALEIWPVGSPHARARIVSIDASEALAMPGVVTVLTARDVPGQNDVGAVRHDEPLFADTEASFHGHIVAVVVGTSVEASRAAAAKVRVVYEPLPAILSVEQAIACESFHTQPHVIRRGDARAALAASPRRLSFSMEIGGQEHFYLEAHAAFAECGDDGDVRVSSSTQHPSEVQAVVSHVLHLPRNRVVVTAPRMGGGFGGKETQGNTWAAIVALAAWKTRRPTRVQLDRDVDMALTGKRHPFRGEVEIGFDEQGRVLALVASLVSDGGWALDLSESITDRALFHIDNAYYLPAVEVTGRVARTHHVSHTAFRGFGGPQGMVFIEEALDRIARTLGLRPEVVRERNLYRGSGETATTHYGQELQDVRAERVFRTLLERSAFAARRQEIDRFNASQKLRKRGLAITPVKFGISFTATFLNQAGALVMAYRDGTLQVNHGGTEMGQGLYTKVRGVAMRELGVSAAAVRVMKTQTDKVPNTSATAASSGADLNGAAVRNACETLRGRLSEFAAPLLGCAPEAVRFEGERVFCKDAPEGGLSFAALCEKAYVAQVNLSAQGFYRTPGIGYDRQKGRGKPFYYFAWGAAVSEVEVDAASGMKRVLRVDVLHDVGDSLHPAIDVGQIEGAFVQGAGWLTSEELRWDDRGRLLTHSASTYQIPAISDAPPDFRVELLEGATQPGVVHGSKAVGEPPFMLAISVREALRDAVAAFGSGGVVELASPATHEALYRAIRTVQS